MGEFGPWHLLIVAIVFVALFGYKRLPDASKNLARSLHIFKTEMKSLHDDDHATMPVAATPPAAAATPPAAVAEPALTDVIPESIHTS